MVFVSLVVFRRGNDVIGQIRRVLFQSRPIPQWRILFKSDYCFFYFKSARILAIGYLKVDFFPLAHALFKALLFICAVSIIILGFYVI